LLCLTGADLEFPYIGGRNKRVDAS
jgi:hypothetical protein